MGLFKSKQDKEIEKKMLIKKTMNSMQKHISKLEEQKKVYIEAAKSAKQKGLTAQVNLAISGLKMTMAQQKKAQEMMLNFEITSQMKDMTMMTSEFLKGMSTLSKEMTKLTDNKDFAKVQKQFEVAMSSVDKRSMEMEVFLDMSSSEFASQSVDPSGIKDEEIMALIDDVASDDELATETNIDDVLKSLREKMSSK